MIGDPVASDTWRPQTFGNRNAKKIPDPVIEPLWSGVRVLVHLAAGKASISDSDGREVHRPDLTDAIVESAQAGSAVLDGYLTDQAAHSGIGVRIATPTAAPTAGAMARQMLLGGTRNRRAELVEALEDAAPDAAATTSESVFVAVDLLALDGESLLDVPLLERKRLLDSILVGGPLVRIGIHVRPPVDPWLGTWRTLGFRKLAYKDANGRYTPGRPSDGWAQADIPRG